MHKKPALYIVLLLLFFLTAGGAWGQDQEQSTNNGQLHGIARFGRGVVNIISSPLELLAQPYARASYRDEQSNNQFAVLGGFFEGIPMGFVYFGWRLGAGFYDMFTFPFYCYDESIIHPEYLTFSPEFLESP
jgi:putative exosortase-associated protein (TIGR04073 family)